ncbi:MAG: hypothetical protein HY000_36695 [Planctomycetes bacterium]|nr:hypothetical protein [Planctomycetota bacterium]
MATPQGRSTRRLTAEVRRISQRATPGILQQRSLGLVDDQPLPAVHLSSARYHPFLYRKMIGRVDSFAQPGDLVAVFDRAGKLLGHGLYNPRSEIVVRMLNHEAAPPDETFWQRRLEEAVRLRRELLRLDEVTDAYRVVHAEGDGRCRRLHSVWACFSVRSSCCSDWPGCAEFVIGKCKLSLRYTARKVSCPIRFARRTFQGE